MGLTNAFVLTGCIYFFLSPEEWYFISENVANISPNDKIDPVKDITKHIFFLA